MIHLEFTDEDIQTFQLERFQHPHPHIQRKMEALLLKSQGLPHGQIAEIVGVCENTLRAYFTSYQAGGIEALKELRFYQPTSELEAHRASIENHFRAHPVATIKEAGSEIEKLTGIRRSPTQVRQFLEKIGLSRRKVGQIPAKADRDRQETFRKEHLEPVLAAAAAGEKDVFFVDAAHFVFAPFLGFLWCFTRLFVRAAAGRSRHNVLGALNAITHDLVSIRNNHYINAAAVCDLMRDIAQRYVTRPITLVMDNARYQKCAFVYETAAELGITLLYLPPYSPNLNLIERLWKLVKKECLYSKCYPDFAAFSAAIDRFLDNAPQTHASKLASLLTLNFQRFPDADQLIDQAA